MDIEMIRFTGLLSIMLLAGWILITIFFIIVSGSMDKVNEGLKSEDKQKMKLDNKENMNKKMY